MNNLNALIRRRILIYCQGRLKIAKYCWFTRNHFKYKRHWQVKSKGIGKNIIHANRNEKTDGLAVFISEKIILYKRQTWELYND